MAAKFTDFYKIVTPKANTTSMTDSQNIGDQGVYANYTWYQRLVQGSASRITRYRECDLMDNDVEIARALDTIAEEMTGNALQSDLPIQLVIKGDKKQNISPTIQMTLKAALAYWCDLHDWHTRLFKIARNTIKYGDCFFVRRSDTKRWEFVHPKNVVAAIVDERDLTKVVGWQIKQEIKKPNSAYNAPVGIGRANEAQVDVYSADEVVWFTLNDDMSESAPFAESILRPIYRAQKQKELLEDAVIIYRIQRAPERRAFYIDVGKMPPQRVKQHLEQLKNEIRQKKVPTAGGGVEQVDSVYNPHSMNEDFFFAQRPDGKGSRVEVLPGGQGLGELADLEYFQWKVYRGLRIPLSYMREGQDGASSSDGKVGLAYIQELRFAQFTCRLQRHVNSVLDKEFKRYLHAAQIFVDPSIFAIKMPDPENFGIYRQQELDSNLLGTYSSSQGIRELSARFKMKKYLQLSDEEMLENERLKLEEMGIDPNAPIVERMAIYRPVPEDGGMGGDMGMPMAAGTLGADYGTDFSASDGAETAGAPPMGASPTPQQ
jgi:hypothetical protein